jgi:hypothetical protein
MFGRRQISCFFALIMLMSLQSSATSNGIVVNFNRYSKYMFINHPVDGSDWVCIFNQTRQVNCAHMSQHHVENIIFTYQGFIKYEQLDGHINNVP